MNSPLPPASDRGPIGDRVAGDLDDDDLDLRLVEPVRLAEAVARLVSLRERQRTATRADTEWFLQGHRLSVVSGLKPRGRR